MTIQYLISESLRHADNSALVDRGWRRDQIGARKGYRDGDGAFVIPVSNAEALRGVSPPSKLYLGYNWHRARGAREAVDIHRHLGGIVETIN